MGKIVPQIETKYNYYSPHHAVEKVDSRTTKLRLVFVASARSTSELSLNNTLKVGLTTQNDFLQF